MAVCVRYLMLISSSTAAAVPLPRWGRLGAPAGAGGCMPLTAINQNLYYYGKSKVAKNQPYTVTEPILFSLYHIPLLSAIPYPQKLRYFLAKSFGHALTPARRPHYRLRSQCSMKVLSNSWARAFGCRLFSLTEKRSKRSLRAKSQTSSRSLTRFISGTA